MIDEALYIGEIKTNIIYHIIDFSQCEPKKAHKKKFNFKYIIKDNDKDTSIKDIIKLEIMYNNKQTIVQDTNEYIHTNKTYVYKYIDKQRNKEYIFNDLMDIRKFHYKMIKRNIPINIQLNKYKEFYYYDKDENSDIYIKKSVYNLIDYQIQLLKNNR